MAREREREQSGVYEADGGESLLANAAWGARFTPARAQNPDASDWSWRTPVNRSSIVSISFCGLKGFVM